MDTAPDEVLDELVEVDELLRKPLDELVDVVDELLRKPLDDDEDEEELLREPLDEDEDEPLREPLLPLNELPPPGRASPSDGASMAAHPNATTSAATSER